MPDDEKKGKPISVLAGEYYKKKGVKSEPPSVVDRVKSLYEDRGQSGMPQHMTSDALGPMGSEAVTGKYKTPQFLDQVAQRQEAQQKVQALVQALGGQEGGSGAPPKGYGVTDDGGISNQGMLELEGMVKNFAKDQDPNQPMHKNQNEQTRNEYHATASAIQGDYYGDNVWNILQSIGGRVVAGLGAGMGIPGLAMAGAGIANVGDKGIKTWQDAKGKDLDAILTKHMARSQASTDAIESVTLAITDQMAMGEWAKPKGKALEQYIKDALKAEGVLDEDMDTAYKKALHRVTMGPSSEQVGRAASAKAQKIEADALERGSDASMAAQRDLALDMGRQILTDNAEHYLGMFAAGDISTAIEELAEEIDKNAATGYPDVHGSGREIAEGIILQQKGFERGLPLDTQKYQGRFFKSPGAMRLVSDLGGAEQGWEELPAEISDDEKKKMVLLKDMSRNRGTSAQLINEFVGRLERDLEPRKDEEGWVLVSRGLLPRLTFIESAPVVFRFPRPVHTKSPPLQPQIDAVVKGWQDGSYPMDNEAMNILKTHYGAFRN